MQQTSKADIFRTKNSGGIRVKDMSHFTLNSKLAFYGSLLVM